jgi:outer membrane protein assembly factor BamD
MRSPAPLAAAALLALAACGSKHVSISGEAKFAASAEENYQAGVELLKDESYPEAQKFFEYVKTKYPFSKYAALADLRLADVKFEQGAWAEAVEAYDEFIQLHPTNEEVDYAEFRRAESYFKDAPGEFVLFPPAAEKDQHQTERAAAALTAFLEKHPGSKYVPQAKALLEQANARLAAREWYVAEFYFKRERWAGAAGRYETLVEKYPGSKHEVEALLKLAQAAVKLDEKHRARTALQKLITRHPQDPRRGEAEKLLAALR